MARTNSQARTVGQEKLREAGDLTSLAASTGIAKSTLSALRAGSLEAPSERVAATLEEKLGIAATSWHEVIGGESPAAPPVSDGDASPRAHLVICRAWRQKLQTDRASPKDITAALEAERRAVELVRKASEEDAEEMLGIIRATLEAYPEARDAVGAALRAAGK